MVILVDMYDQIVIYLHRCSIVWSERHTVGVVDRESSGGSHSGIHILHGLVLVFILVLIIHITASREYLDTPKGIFWKVEASLGL